MAEILGCAFKTGIDWPTLPSALDWPVAHRLGEHTNHTRIEQTDLKGHTQKPHFYKTN